MVSGVSREQIRLLNLNVAVEFSHGVTETQRRFTAGALPQTPKAGQSQAIDWRQIIFYALHLLPITSDKITGFAGFTGLF